MGCARLYRARELRVQLGDRRRRIRRNLGCVCLGLDTDTWVVYTAATASMAKGSQWRAIEPAAENYLQEGFLDVSLGGSLVLAQYGVVKSVSLHSMRVALGAWLNYSSDRSLRGCQPGEPAASPGTPSYHVDMVYVQEMFSRHDPH
eukprot:1934777-Pyramimonas_sp.AAC.1